MQKRINLFFNFFAFNLLFFALYLNFIHKDTEVAMPTLPQSTSIDVNIPAIPAAQARVTEKNDKKVTPAVEEQSEALKLSVN